MPMMCGGLGGVKEVDEDTLDVLSQVEAEVKQKIAETEGRNGQAPHKIQALGYKSQIVAGKNFFIKVKVDDDGFAHIRIYRDLQGGVTLHSVTGPKTDADEIIYF